MDGKGAVTWAQVEDASVMTSREDDGSLMWMREERRKNQKRRDWGQLVPLLMGGARIDKCRPLASSYVSVCSLGEIIFHSRLLTCPDFLFENIQKANTE